MLKTALLLAACAILVFLVYIALQSSHYTISRSISLNRPPKDIFPHLNNPRLMDLWAPWKEIDPQITMTYEGPAEGVGAIARWTSPGPMGVGSAQIIESIPDQLVRTKLTNQKPMVMEQEAIISIEVHGSASTVTWKVSGENTFFSRLVCFFMNMDAKVGGMFETGLQKLKVVTEKS